MAHRAAFGRFTVNDDVLIGILTKRTFRERALIKDAFKTLTGTVRATLKAATS